MADNEIKDPEVNLGEEDVVVELKAGDEGEGQNSEPDFSKVEPEVRKRPIDYIEERRARRAERPDADNGDGEHNEGEDDELSPKAREYLDRKVRENMAPVVKTIAKDFNDREINEVISSNPEFKKYTPLVRKYMEADGWQGVPAKKIFQMLDYEHSGERGADEARHQAVLAKKARGGESARGAAVRGTGALTAEDIAKLTPEQVQNLQRRLTMGENIKT